MRTARKVIDDFGNGLIHDQRRSLNRMAGERGSREAKTAAIDYIIASMMWLAETDGNRATYELMSGCADQLLGEVLETTRR
jgi:hypothetical protein